ncbi:MULTISPECIES: class I SAM-dependent methyltransferase [unclassified Ruegeria]|uniref:class I SAM-dependent methyltransferase n=1 Tax=unclassified Ruegeria TaxID=2625375 RepID=UPI0014915257|nr:MULTISPECIES: class I SAM-dependent methyltransferase [unclassified Ruegeria]NOD78570.1 methyltransferase domain-containing protein [Ruegeria sp. HKCCD4332]NOD90943.1 methyltransferase domain-containing protein [Ruegeria sp. HKCCD4318]NOD95223.1 methyltransferase domain-containing protein [Ruegeria sp. HKCCD4884]NOE16331.1 methyltransferase domain-containing protein [Ruegeria sp. HKCCD4318-2]NOG11803.1 methyltransferase domain-containing protein [Ruegeria sp. HKCCD4315]
MAIHNHLLSQIKIGSGDFVVDVGGGHRPFHRADLVVEKFPFDSDLHRSQPVMFPDAPLVIASAENLPIADQSCDLLFSSHCIEHLPDPPQFIEEIKRCAKSVYLEFPSRRLEMMFAWNFHPWLIEVEGTRLICYRNDVPQFFGDMFHKEYDAAIGAWGELHHEELNTSLYCNTSELECVISEETAIEMLVRTSPRGQDRVNMSLPVSRPRYSLRHVLALAAQSYLPRSVYDWLQKPRRFKTTPTDLSLDILPNLRCLECNKSDLAPKNETLVCSCGAIYARDRGVLDFDHILH